MMFNEEEESLEQMLTAEQLEEHRGREEREDSPESETQKELLYCSQSPMARSTYYQTNSTTLGVSPLARPWVSPPARTLKKSFFTHRQSIQKHQNPQKIVPDSSPERSSFRLRLIKPISTIFDLKPVLSAQSYIAMWADNGETLLSQCSEEQRQIASLTKIMTAYTVLGLCKEYQVKVREQWIPVHTRASYMEGTSANLRSGEEVLLVDLLYGLLLPSGNDAGIALAQYFGKFLSFKYTKEQSMERYTPNLEEFNECRGYYDQEYEKESIRLFVFEMNRYAHTLGLANTRFDNPTGLTNSSNYSTPLDMARLTRICLRSHLLRQIFRRKVHKCEVRNDKLGYNREVLWHNTNQHLYKIRECIGVKTGITPGAGPCLSSAYRIGSRELIVIVLGCKDREARFEDAEKVYRWCRKQNILR